MENFYSPRTRRKSPTRKRVGVALLVFFLILIGIGIYKVANYLPVLWQLASQHDVKLKETPEKKVNILLLGIGGGDHDGPDLTDTIIFSSVDPKTKKVTLMSLPRDLWIPEISSKINGNYTFAEEKQKGSGLQSTKAIVSNIMGQQIDYAVKIDFSGFEKAVDEMGGLDIDVARTFDDYAYPITGKERDPCGKNETQIASLSGQLASGSATELDAFPCRYEHLHFNKGKQHMNGTTALKYVRSRHALGKEGSDFARSQRQAKVITAFKDKLFSAGTLLNPAKVTNIISTLEGSIEMDIKQDEIDDFVRLAQQMKGSKVVSGVVDTGDGDEDRLGLLVNPPISAEFGNAWVLTPRAGSEDYSEIQAYVRCVLAGKTCLVTDYGIATPTPKPKKTPTPSIHRTAQ